MSARTTKQKGVVLVLVLWVVALLSLMLAGLVAATRARLHDMREANEDARGRQLLLELGKICLKDLQQDSKTEVDSFQEAWGQRRTWNAKDLLAEAGVNTTADEECVLRVSAADESSKININYASPSLVERCVRVTGAVPDAAEIANAIIDWRDPDDAGPFERDYYARCNPPYEPANADFTFMTELLFVANVTPGIYRGEDANHNGLLDPEEDDGSLFYPYDNADGKLQVGLADVFTAQGDNTINLNTVSEPVLKAVLGLTLPESQADELGKQICSQRRGRDGLDGTADDKPFAKEEDVTKAMGAETLNALRTAGVTVGLTSKVFRFYLSVEFPAQHYVMETEMTVLRDNDELKVIEWCEHF